MNTIKYPCMGCKERKLACHDNCKTYKDFCCEKNKIKQLKKKGIDADAVKFNSIFRGCDVRDKKGI
ncbi:hypothetical protein [Clostridium butyricum]|uniref:hypothetical protein n=1 Tax=Clostridium butyricum TaxID=1492 RepID=UPI0013CF7B78|nr:hypothetical protein [Clostridium butyricum]MCQ2017265.1 hypothetical protein [Clostridium butyricum]MCQ2021138.1 hypothetical protein [Clostridium butyricum]NFB72496.1 hypothetical protein [Clostridium butyricum]NFB91579.1 hypothetical protein [Clostridium butyricum]UTY53595.1 hypothetical protein HNS01_11010 [Clostridium butyricum]